MLKFHLQSFQMWGTVPDLGGLSMLRLRTLSMSVLRTNVKLLSIFAAAGLSMTCLAGQKQLAPGHVPPIVKQLQPTGELPGQAQLTLAIGLPLRNTAGLDSLLREIYDPASPSYHHYLTAEEFARQFGPTDEQYQAVAAFAASNHLSVVGTHNNRMLLDVSGAVSDIGRTFSIHLKTYKRPNGQGSFYAPDTEPSVPENAPILDVSGLSNYKPPQPMAILKRPLDNASQAQPQGGSGPSGTYMGNDFRAAYVPGVALTGAGQVVGLLEFDGFYAKDITNYETQAGLPAVPVQTVLLDGYNGTPTKGANSGNPEVSLDIEMAIAMAPGLTEIISYEAGPSGTPNDILNRMASDNLAKELSSSWTWSGGPSSTTDQIFQEMAAQGQSMFQASGDSDAYTSGELGSSTGETTPADSPYLTSVGGTTLTTSGPGGSYVSEKVWNWGNGTGSSGGTSIHYSIPSWQQGISMANNGGSTTMRNIPDVALTGDNIYVTYGNGSSGDFGGTSCATPLWAAFIALVNQQAVSYGGSLAGFLNPTIYSIGKGSSYTLLMHDITIGSDTNSASPTEFYAVAGYDLASGWGSPGGASLINALAPQPDSMGVTPIAGYGSFGPPGGPFTLNSAVFTITNSGNSPVNWTVANNASWLNVSSSNGTVAAGAATGVTVSLNATANTLAPGTYTASLVFTDSGTGYQVDRQFVLTNSAQMLQNGGFESGNFSGWTQSGNTAYTSVTTSSSYVHSGSYGAEFGPNSTPGYISQTVATVPGQTYLLSCWMDIPSSGTPNLFTISWGGNLVYGLTNYSKALAWTNLQFLVTAKSTSTVVQFGFRNDPNYTGFDDASLVPIASPTLKSMTKSNSTLQFTLSTTAGAVYQVQYTTNLMQKTWLNLGSPVTASGPTTVFTDPGATDSQRFYRVIIAP